MPAAGFVPAIPAGDGLQTYAIIIVIIIISIIIIVVLPPPNIFICTCKFCGELLKKRPTNAPVVCFLSHLFAATCFGPLIRPSSGRSILENTIGCNICNRAKFSFTMHYAVP
jgi:hypothetical protein